MVQIAGSLASLAAICTKHTPLGSHFAPKTHDLLRKSSVFDAKCSPRRVSLLQIGLWFASLRLAEPILQQARASGPLASLAEARSPAGHQPSAESPSGGGLRPPPFASQMGPPPWGQAPKPPSSGPLARSLRSLRPLRAAFGSKNNTKREFAPLEGLFLGPKRVTNAR